MNALRRGVKNAFRNSMRTVGVVVILAVAIALSISMLIARSAVTSKIDSVKASTGTTINVSPAGFFGGFGGGTPLTTAEVTKLLGLSDVTSVQAQLTEQLSSTQTSLKSPITAGSLGGRFGNGSSTSSGTGSSGGFSGFGGGTFRLTIRVVGTNSPGTALTAAGNGGGSEKLVSGKAFAATSTADVAIIGKDMATKNKLTVGSTFTAWGKKITVVGIYNAGSTFANADVLMPLATVQTLAKATGEITNATVVVNNISNVSSVSSAISKELGSKADVTSTEATIASELSPLNSVRTISTYTLVGAVIAAAIILLLSMLMIVRERRREVGVLKALGATNRSVVGQFVSESTTFTLLGAVVGFLLGVVISSPITSALVSASGGSSTSGPGGFIRGTGGGFGNGGSGFTPPSGGFGGGGVGFRGFRGLSNTLTQLHTSVGVSTLIFALVAAIVIAALGSSVAAATITRIRPAEVLRSE